MEITKYVGIGGTALTKQQWEICLKCDYCHVPHTGDCEKIRLTHIFIGKQGKYQIPSGTEVRLIKCYAKRKCVIEYQGEEIITMVSLLRRIK